MPAGALRQLRSTPDGDGSLLDHSILMYGSGMSNSNLHSHKSLPIVVVGGGAGRIKGDRHVQSANLTPIANLLLSLGQKMGCQIERFGDSSGEIDL